MNALARFCGSHKVHAAWVGGALMGLTLVLQQFGLLPWATHQRLMEVKAEAHAEVVATQIEVNLGLARLEAANLRLQDQLRELDRYLRSREARR